MAVSDGLCDRSPKATDLNAQTITAGSAAQHGNTRCLPLLLVSFIAQAVGLPLCLSDLNLTSDVNDKLDIVVAACLVKGNLCLNMHIDLTADMIKEAILRTDAEGKALKTAAALGGTQQWALKQGTK